MAGDRFSAEEVDAAVRALGDPERFTHAQEIVTHAAPGLQRVLERGARRGRLVRERPSRPGAPGRRPGRPAGREQAVHVLVEEETRLGMLVGVAVGLELAAELRRARGDGDTEDDDPKET